MLGPTSRLADWLSRIDPIWESGVGYVDFSHGIIIAPACAGINFLIMAFGLAAFCGLVRIRRPLPLGFYLVGSLMGAYLLAVAVNSMRIAFSVYLYQADIYAGWLTIERVHRLMGVGLYLGALGLFFTGLQPIISRICERFEHHRRQRHRILPAWLPFPWYILGAVGVPAVNVLIHDSPPGFGEHCVTIVLVVLGLWCLGCFFNRLMRRCIESTGNHNDRRG
jgi:exosortase K